MIILHPNTTSLGPGKAALWDYFVSTPIAIESAGLRLRWHSLDFMFFMVHQPDSSTPKPFVCALCSALVPYYQCLSLWQYISSFQNPYPQALLFPFFAQTCCSGLQ